MPRKRRFYLPGFPIHAMQRGHNREAIFFDDDDYREYLISVKTNAEKYGCQIHAYILMTNHVHFLLTPELKDSVSQFFQGLGRHYVRYVNKKYNRSGSLWEGRHKGNLIDTDLYLLRCMQYIELNPVRAKMVDSPSEYYWSSYACNALGHDNSIITPHKAYLDISSVLYKRLSIYESMVNLESNKQEDTRLEVSLKSGTPIGNENFILEIEKKLKCLIGHVKPGRPQL